MPSAPASLTRALRRPLWAACALLLVYIALSLLMSPKGYLGTDTGAKVATLEVMDQRGTASPDVGYWAERWDPDGEVHPLYQTRHLTDGNWVAVTTLPMLEVARPLYGLGGYRATLLLPMLGALGCAFAARALARRLGAEPMGQASRKYGDVSGPPAAPRLADPRISSRARSDGWTAFWMVGLGSPILLYALDFWEHSIGVAFVLVAVVVLLDAVDGRPGWWRALVAGALFGAAASLRTEAIVYALVAVGACCVALLARHRRLVQPVIIGVGAVAGFATVWGLNRALEVTAGGVSRTDRATGAAQHAADQTGDRINQGLVTLLGMKGDAVSSWCLGIGVVAVLLLAVRADRRGDQTLTKVCFALAGLVYLLTSFTDLSFIPGLVPAFPIAFGAVLVRHRDTRAIVLGVALGALPLVWAFQYVGGGGPQWGGRYTLTSSVLLGTLALVTLGTAHPAIRQGLIGLSIGVTLLGVVWVGVRTRSVDALFDDLRNVDADVLIMRDAFLLREGGPVVLDEHWLTAAGEDQFTTATEVAEASGAHTVAVVELGAAAPPPSVIPSGWVEQEHTVTDLTGDPIGVVVYRLP